ELVFRHRRISGSCPNNGTNGSQPTLCARKMTGKAPEKVHFT
ncbi:unnamed protein product, partial [Rotaria magnacalcarata]